MVAIIIATLCFYFHAYNRWGLFEPMQETHQLCQLKYFSNGIRSEQRQTTNPNRSPNIWTLKTSDAISWILYLLRLFFEMQSALLATWRPFVLIGKLIHQFKLETFTRVRFDRTKCGKSQISLESLIIAAANESNMTEFNITDKYPSPFSFYQLFCEKYNRDRKYRSDRCQLLQMMAQFMELLIGGGWK